VAHSLSSKKRIRQNDTRRAINRSRRSALRSRLRRCMDLFQHGSVQDAEEAVRQAQRTLDREANRGTLHRNAAARRKHRLMRRLNGMRTAQTASA
jgi:small subunit ribosomal protein S20